jgi:hypothetical protein
MAKGDQMGKKNWISTVLITISLTICMYMPAHADRYTDTIEIFRKPDVVQPFFKSAYGYAVFPTIGKGGMGIGGSFGTGQVYRGGRAMGETYLAKITFGFQLGGQAFSQMIFFKDKRAYDEFTSGSFEFDASASAVVINGGGPHRLDSLRGRISYEPRAFEKIKRHQAASAKGWGRP